MTTSFAFRLCFDERRRRPQTFEVGGKNVCGLFACLYIFFSTAQLFRGTKGDAVFSNLKIIRRFAWLLLLSLNHDQI